MRRRSSKGTVKTPPKRKQKKLFRNNKGGRKTSPLSRRDPEVEALDRLYMAVIKALQNNIRQASASNPQFKVLEKQINDSYDRIIRPILEKDVLGAINKIGKDATQHIDARTATRTSKKAAQDTLKHSSRLRAELKSGNPRKAAWHALWIGMMYERMHFWRHEKNIDSAKRMLEAFARGRVKHHGTPEERHERWAGYQKEVNRIKRENPNLTQGRIWQLVAKKFGVSPKTVQRRTKFPT